MLPNKSPQHLRGTCKRRSTPDQGLMNPFSRIMTCCRCRTHVTPLEHSSTLCCFRFSSCGNFVGDHKVWFSGDLAHKTWNIWCHIHSLMPLQDAAQCANISHMFLRSWRCHPNLKFTEDTLCLKQNESREDLARRLTMATDQILKNHSGIGIKTLEISFAYDWKVDACDLNRWFQIAIVPGIEEVVLFLPMNYRKSYTFPCSLLFGGCGNSIRYIRLGNCAFRPPVGFNCLRSLTKLRLEQVCITGDELASLISNCFVLEKLELISCNELIFLKIPLWLERLSFLMVVSCGMLRVIESKAPNLFNFRFFSGPVHLSLGESSQVKNIDINYRRKPNSLRYAITTLPSAAPNVETLKVTSFDERVNTPMVADKFLNLKYLNIHLVDCCKAFSPFYNYLSLVSFLDASPTLETFILSVTQNAMMHNSIFEDALDVRQIPGHKHGRLRKVQINGFCSAKSMVELTCHILENATSLESLTLNTIFDYEKTVDGYCSWCCVKRKCCTRPISRDMILEAHKALKVISMCIVGRVPPAVKLNVGEPCSMCHDISNI